jgi:hypothetical protein
MMGMGMGCYNPMGNSPLTSLVVPQEHVSLSQLQLVFSQRDQNNNKNLAEYPLVFLLLL